MGDFTNCALGLNLDEKTWPVDKSLLSGIDFLMAKAVVGDQVNGKFTGHVQTAYELGLPILAEFYPMIEPYELIDKERFPQAKDDVQVQAMKASIFYGADLKNKRAVHGVRIWLPAPVYADGNRETQSNYAKIVAHWVSCVSAFGLPTYVVAPKNLLSMFDSDPVNVSQLLGDLNLVCSNLSAGLSSVTKLVSATDLKSYLVKMGSYVKPFVAAVNCRFFGVAFTAFKVRGIASGTVYVPVTLYEGNKASLYAALSFGGTTPVVVDPTPVVTLDTLNAKLDQIIAKLK